VCLWARSNGAVGGIMADRGVSKMNKNYKKVYIPPLPLPPARPEEVQKEFL